MTTDEVGGAEASTSQARGADDQSRPKVDDPSPLAIAAEFMRGRQNTFWSQRGTPSTALGDREEVGKRLRAHYNGMEFADDTERERWTVELESFLAHWTDRPSSSWETAATDGIIRRVAEPILRYARRRYPDRASPLVGTAHHGLQTANAYNVPGSDVAVILLDVGLVTAVHVFAELIAEIFPTRESVDGRTLMITDPDEIEARLRHRPDLAIRASYIATRFASGEGADTRMLSTRLAHNSIGDLFRDVAETFVTSHEIAHVMLGHLDGWPSDQPVIVGDDSACETRDSSDGELEGGAPAREDAETEADVRGVEYAIAVLSERGIPPAVGSLGPEIYFGVLLLVRQVEAARVRADLSLVDLSLVDGGGGVGYRSLQFRRAHVRAVLERSMPEQDLASYHRARDAVESALAAILWASVRTVDVCLGRPVRPTRVPGDV